MIAVAARRTGFAIIAIACLGIAGYGMPYLLGYGAASNVLENPRANPWLYVHIACGMVAIALGPWQFLTRLRTRWHLLHRWIGRTYAVACLAGGTAGMLLAVGATMGTTTRWGFGLLAASWLVTTALAWITARKRDYVAHRQWMVRSFALTLAALTLRIYLPLSLGNGAPFTDAYPAIAWLCWVPNLILAEAYLRWRPLP